MKNSAKLIDLKGFIKQKTLPKRKGYQDKKL